MIDVYHCPKCSRLLKCEGVVSIGGRDLPVFQCEDCIVRKAVFGPGTEEFELAYTFCVDSAGRCFDPAEDLGVDDTDVECDDGSGPDPSLNEPGGVSFPGIMARLMSVVPATGAPSEESRAWSWQTSIRGCR